MNNTKTYCAVLQQAGATPPQEIFAKSDFITPVVWTRVQEGEYRGECADGWIKERTHVLVNGSNNAPLLLGAVITNDNEATIYLNNEDSVNRINLEIKYFL